ncbi:hypothetical protein [Streptomyces sp. NBC_00986]|nr:hypothetical protein OG504_20820 [Streptomyces sp. NBC_00986]
MDGMPCSGCSAGTSTGAPRLWQGADIQLDNVNRSDHTGFTDS